MNCCNDVVSCAGAVVSGGATCAAEAAVAALRAAIAGIERERDERQAAFEAGLAAARRDADAALDHWTDIAGRARQDVDHYANEAAAIVAGDVEQWRHAISTTQPAVLAGDPNARDRLLAEHRDLLIDDSLSVLRARLMAERNRAIQAVGLTQQSKEEQARVLSEMWARLGSLFVVVFGSAIAAILLRLSQAFKDPVLALPTAAAAAASMLQAAIAAVEAAMPKELEEEKARRAVALATPAPYAAEAAAHAERAREILQAMRRAANLRELAERELVVRDMALAAAPIPERDMPAMLESAELAAATHAVAPSLASLCPDLTHLSSPIAPVEVAPHRERLKLDLDTRFRPQPGQDPRDELGNLLAQARQRYGGDPNLLAGVEQFLRAEAQARGVRASP